MATVMERRKNFVASPTDWATDDLVLGLGEIAFELGDDDIMRMKVGDGSSTFTALDYTIDPQWQKVGNDIYNLNSANVGIGTDSPPDRLTVYGGDYTAGVYRDDIVTDGQNLGIAAFGALSEGSVMSVGALIRGQAVGNWSDTNFGAGLTFNVTAQDTTTLVRGAYLDDAGNLLIEGEVLRIVTSKTPASASDTGLAGQICWDSDYLYVCVAADTWKRVALATW